MPKVSYVQPDDSVETLDVALGVSVMQGAITAGVDGIVAECGGNAMCATCHVYVTDEDDRARLPPIGVAEDDMLDSTISERTDESRLSCQLAMTDELDGLTVRIPPEQL